jgi:hypothetical protein
MAKNLGEKSGDKERRGGGGEEGMVCLGRGIEWSGKEEEQRGEKKLQ